MEKELLEIIERQQQILNNLDERMKLMNEFLRSLDKELKLVGNLTLTISNTMNHLAKEKK